MRISAGSRGLSRNGGNIHVHPEIPFITIRPKIKNANSQSIPLASLEIRDAVFRELIRISPASNYRQELVTCPGGLLSRGLLEEHATSYGALPRTKRERATLAGILNHYVSARFPAYAQSRSGAGVVGIPGFWQELSGVVHIWKPRNYLMPLQSCSASAYFGLIQIHYREIAERLRHIEMLWTKHLLSNRRNRHVARAYGLAAPRNLRMSMAEGPASRRSIKRPASIDLGTRPRLRRRRFDLHPFRRIHLREVNPNPKENS